MASEDTQQLLPTAMCIAATCIGQVAITFLAFRTGEYWPYAVSFGPELRLTHARNGCGLLRHYACHICPLSSR